MKVKSLSRVRLVATPWTAAYQAPPSMGFSRQEYWSGVPLPSLPEQLKSKQITKKSQLNLKLLTGAVLYTGPWHAASVGCFAVQSLSCVRSLRPHGLQHTRLQFSLSLFFTISWSLLRLTSIESMMPSSHLILGRPLLLLPLIFPSIRVSSNESALPMRWPK